MTQQRVFAERWKALDPSANIMLIPSIEEALNTARSIAEKEGDKKVQALVTGSLHLVGGALGILEGADAL
jgi:folylpolyglutamate synthase